MKTRSQIKKLYYTVEQEKNTNPTYRKLITKFNESTDKLREELKPSQITQLEKILQLRNNMESEEVSDFFIEGFKMATRLIIDGYKKEQLQEQK